ncbi:hypothetical protein [Mangrovitalea sediminis]|uniref:hypothetical protein n=1 Tax=Mangrovitalea sediminis TaxID=1982043 RepID=UPI000BE57820|nr:hypothetical protein [Mangrovitalea sediminis]
MTIRDFERIDLHTGETGKGDFFVGPQGQQFNLSNVHILHCGVDTVRQMYQGHLRERELANVVMAYEEGRDTHTKVLGETFVVGGGGKSGYQYRLQNNELGLILFVKSTYAEQDARHNHLKIECSPHYIAERSAEQLQADLDRFATYFLKAIEGTGVAVHLAVDVQGWRPGRHFHDNLTARARPNLDARGISTMTFDLPSVAMIYGEFETITYGKANALQFSVYDKRKEAQKKDKWHYWEAIYQKHPQYDPEGPVTRLEMRFHHSVVREIAQGTDLSYIDTETGELIRQQPEAFNTFLGVFPHLDGLWRFAMTRYRLDIARNWVHPVWTKFREDARFVSQPHDVEYKRLRKPPGEGNEKNVALVLGNLLSIYARHNMPAHQVWACLKQTGIWEDIINYHRRREIYENELFQLIQKALIDRRLRGKAA